MSVQNIANQLVNLCRQGKFDEAVQELYSPNIVSIEPPGAGFTERTEGMEAFDAKGELWKSMVEEFHGIEVSEPTVAGNYFTCKMSMDVTMKGQPRSKSEEICLYEVKDGKVVKEQFFYTNPEG